MRHLHAPILLAAAVLAVAACEEGAEPEAGAGTDTTAALEGPAAPAPPDTTAEALWAHLQEADYRATWETWPGKGELYPGTDPHGMLLTTYLNPAAYEALENGAGTMPAGAIIVKENYMPDSTLAAVTTMMKSPGYDPDHADWFWAKQDPAGVAEVAGRGEMCIACHGQRAGNDYVFTGELGAAE